MGETRRAAVGAFVLGGILLFGVGLFMIGDRRRLFEESFEVHAEFSRLAGLQNGAKVRVAGMEAGEVEEIRFPSSPAAKFRVRMRILSRIRPLVRTDSVATIQTDGIVGNKLVDVGAGSSSAPIAEDGSTVESREPFELADVLQTASEAVATLDEAVASLRVDAEAAVSALGDAVTTVESVIENVGTDLEAMSSSARGITSDVEAMVARVEAGEGTLGRLVNDDAFYLSAVATAERVNRMSGDAAALVENVRKLSDDARGVLEDLRTEGGPAPGLVADLAETLASAREAMSDMAESMESAKRNFLFRGLFEERGFYDIDSLTTEEYLEGGIRKHHRTVRIWIPREELYETGPSGLRLSERGKARIDSAMREILKYPQNSPLMVEGYCDLGALEERFLASREMSSKVYDHLVGKYHRSPNYTSFIAMEALAPQNVTIAEDDSQCGVVLSLFHDGDDEVAPRHRTIR